jgi:hypothetical protein
MTTREVYEVMPDHSVGGWRVVNSNGTCLKRTTTKRDAVRAGASRARACAEGSWARDPLDATLRVRDSNGRFDFERNYVRVA